MSVLVVDVGTSSVRASLVRPDGTVAATHSSPMLPTSPAPGLVEFDAAEMAAVAVGIATAVLHEAGPADAVGITNQRGSTVVWDRSTGEPVAPGIGWQDLRTVGECLALHAEGFHLAPNVSATKLRWLLDRADPERTRDLCFGTVDGWIARALSDGACHVIDATNAGVTGLRSLDNRGWDEHVLGALNIPPGCLPDVVASSGELAPARALPGTPPITGLAGDQQASLLGQGCVRPGSAKITFGTGGMLDCIFGSERPPFTPRGKGGTFPITAWRIGDTDTWGVEAIMLSAGTCVEWLRDDLGVIDAAADSHAVAAQCTDSGGVVFVPALLGLGTPRWDYGARGAFFGLTRGTGRPEVVRAVLEGVAQRGADLVEAAEADTGLTIPALRVDGGMSRNTTFVQALADAVCKPVEISPVTEATTLGAAFLAGLAIGTWRSLDEATATWAPASTVEPGTPLDRDRWRAAVERAAGWIPDLSALEL